MNEHTEYCKVFEDKNLLCLLGETAGVKTPETLLSCSDGVYQDCRKRIISRKEAILYMKNIKNNVFIKPSKESYGGKKCMLLDLSNQNINIDSILKEYGKNFVIQKPAKQFRIFILRV